MPTHAPNAVDLYLATFMDVAGVGGGASARQAVADACAARGLTVEVLGTGGQPTAPDPLAAATPGADLGISAGVDVGIGAAASASAAPRTAAAGVRWRRVVLPPEPFLWRLPSWRTAPRLARVLRDLPPPRRLFVAYSPFWALAARRAWPGCPVAFIYPCLLTTCLPYTWNPAEPRGLWARLDYAALRRTERAALTHAARCFVATQSGRDEILSLAPHARVEVVPFGCRRFERSDEQRRRQRAALGAGEDACVVGLVGYNDRNKAFDLAIRALPHTDPRVVLVICGDGPHRAACEAAARDAGVCMTTTRAAGQGDSAPREVGDSGTAARDVRAAPRVHFAGWQRDMAPWYAAFDVVASVSGYDAFPNVIREGLAAGLPVVVPQHDPPRVFAGVADAVQASGGGLLFDRTASATLATGTAPATHANGTGMGSPATLATCLSRLAADPTLRTKLGARGRAYAEQHFHWDGLIERLLALA